MIFKLLLYEKVAQEVQCKLFSFHLWLKSGRNNWSHPPSTILLSCVSMWNVKKTISSHTLDEQM